MTGSSFYEQSDTLNAYREHRASRVHSANWVMEEPALLAELAEVRDLAVIDLGCGDAELGRTLLAAGCRSYLGVDGSALMVDLARQTLEGTAGTVVRAELEQFAAPEQSAELVISRLALHYVEDLAEVLRRCHDMLVPGGRLVVTVVHPMISSAEVAPDHGRPRVDCTVSQYFSAGPRRRRWLGGTTTWYHRTVEQYVTAFTSAGFGLTALRECAPVPERFEGDDAELDRRRQVALFLLLAGVRQNG